MIDTTRRWHWPLSAPDAYCAHGKPTLAWSYLGDHIRANVTGAVCPASDECCTIILMESIPMSSSISSISWQKRFPVGLQTSTAHR